MMNKKLIVASVVFGLSMTACAPKGPVEPIKSPKQVWIEAHPTSMGDAGECIEFDGEDCDEDPYDLDDMTEYDKHGYTKPPTKPAAKKTPAAPKPKVTGTRR